MPMMFSTAFPKKLRKRERVKYLVEVIELIESERGRDTRDGRRDGIPVE